MDFSFMGYTGVTSLALRNALALICGLSKAGAGIRFTMLKQVERRRIILRVVLQVCIPDDDDFARAPG
jgi:hypothetical protein